MIFGIFVHRFVESVGFVWSLADGSSFHQLWPNHTLVYLLISLCELFSRSSKSFPKMLSDLQIRIHVIYIFVYVLFLRKGHARFYFV